MAWQTLYVAGGGTSHAAAAPHTSAVDERSMDRAGVAPYRLAMITRAGLLAFLGALALAGSLPTRASAQLLVAVEPHTDREGLLARSDVELSQAPIPLDAATVAFELEVLDAQRNAVDIGGITALQWTSAVVIILGVVTMAVMGLGAAFVSATSNPEAGGTFAAVGGSVLLGTVVLGTLGLGLAELDGNLHHRRAIDGRIRALRRARRAAGLALEGGAPTLRF